MSDTLEPGKLTVDEFLRLASGIVGLVAGTGTRLSADDQAKIDALKAKLDANDPGVAEALL